MVAKRTDAYILPVVKKFIAVWNDHDLESLAGFYSDRIVREGRRETLNGKEALKGSWERVLRAFPDLAVDYRHQFSVGTHGVLEWVMRGTHRGVYATDLGDIPPTGKKAEWTGVSVWEVDQQGLILREHIYPDKAGLLQQLGVLKKAA